MNPTPLDKEPEVAKYAKTACGSRVLITPDTPSVHYRGEIIHFCGEDCRQSYSEDPLNSCLASRLLSNE